MEITFINVGYGDAIMVKHNSKYGLIDGGSSLETEFNGNRISLKNYLIKEHITKLDFIIITHIHEDHVCGIYEILNNVKIETLYVPYLPNIINKEDLIIEQYYSISIKLFTKALNAYKNILKFVKLNNIKCQNILEFENLKTFEDININVLEPTILKSNIFSKRLEKAFSCQEKMEKYKILKALDKDSNDYSIVLRIIYNNFSFMLTADNCPKNWDDKTFYFLKNENVLKLPHHGQADAINAKFLEYINADYIITSSSSDRRNNSSNEKVYRKLKQVKNDTKFIFTDEVQYDPYFIGKRDTKNSIKFKVKQDKLEVIM